jgi:hypothetical protein
MLQIIERKVYTYIGSKSDAKNFSGVGEELQSCRNLLRTTPDFQTD